MIQLYVHPLSQHARRVVALLDANTIEYEAKRVSLETGEHHSPSYLAINPNHQVPTLIDSVTKIHESNAIMRYLCLKYALNEWYPSELAKRAQIEQWLDWNQTRLGPAVIDVVFNKVFMGDKGDKLAIERGQTRLLELAPILEEGLKAQPFLGGDNPSIADLSVASNVTHLALAGAEPKTNNINSWMLRMCAIEAFRRTIVSLEESH